MNAPTHIACGACLALILASRHGLPKTPTRASGLAVVAVLVGCLSHLLLDLIPHYAWIVYLDWFSSLPFHWLIREGLFGLAVAIPALIISGKFWPYVACGMFGGLYPDVEKVLSVDFNIPDAFVLFDWHSTQLSGNTMDLPNAVLIAIECGIVAVCMAAMWEIQNQHRKGNIGGVGSEAR